MKKLLLFLILITAGTFLSSYRLPGYEPELVGTWSGIYDNRQLIFHPEGFIDLTSEGKLLDGRRYMEEGQAFSISYEVNTQTNPKQIDYVIYNLDDEEASTERMKGIYELITPTKLKLAFGENSNIRPESFKKLNKNEVLIFEKVKPENK